MLGFKKKGPKNIDQMQNIGKPLLEIRPCRLNPQMESIGAKKILRVNCSDCFSNASIGNPVCMDGLLKTLSEKPEKPTEIVLRKRFNKIFQGGDVENLINLAQIVKTIKLDSFCEGCKKIFEDIWGDPAYVYYKLKDRNCNNCKDKIKETLSALEKSETIDALIKRKTSDYNLLFNAQLIPDIVSSFIDPQKPKGRIEISYRIGDVPVSIFSQEGRPDMYYFAEFPEFNLGKEDVETIHKVFEMLSSRRKNIDLSPEKVREDFRRHIKTILEDIKKPDDFSKLEKIILRHTIGYCSIEPLLLDEKIQDVYVDSASPQVHIVHADFGECVTNIYAASEEIEKLSTRMRALSKRPFDASSPVIHTELQDIGVRVCGICEPATYKGTGFAFRKRKPVPWTLAEFVANKMMDPKTAGLLSYLVDSQNSILITGPRSSGKTSLLTALILEMPRNSRIILIEDTPEIPVNELRSFGFKIEHLKTEAFAKGFEISTEDALRTTLRLGDSILVIGEVRGQEAKALFEAMRVGAAGNVVLGTIHGSNAYDTFDRVVNDLGVPATSFKAVDFVVTAGHVKRGDDPRRYRRLLEITEVSKKWVDKPRFKKLVSYKPFSDSWKSEIRDSEKLKDISSSKSIRLREVLKSISVRSKIKSDLTRLGKKSRAYIEPDMTVKTNSLFTRLAGETDNYKKIYNNINLWLKKC